MGKICFSNRDTHFLCQQREYDGSRVCWDGKGKDRRTKAWEASEGGRDHVQCFFLFHSLRELRMAAARTRRLEYRLREQVIDVLYTY